MDRNAFGRLCYLLQHAGGVSESRACTVPEQVAIFLSVVAHHKKICVVKHDFLCSGRMISKYFHRVLKSIIKLYNVLLAWPTPIIEVCVDPYWRWFKVIFFVSGLRIHCNMLIGT